MMHNEYRPSLANLAQLARTRPGFMASLLDIYQKQRQLNDNQLAEYLECTVEDLTHLALCRRPRANSEFRQDVEHIAQHVHANATQLAKLIRNAEAYESLRDQAHHQSFLAARDREQAAEDDQHDED
jgi:hypothetical protein